MLKMLDNLTSPAGLTSMMSGALGSALQNLAGQIGLGPMLNALNSIMPALSGSLPTSMLKALNSGVNAMITGIPVGALSVESKISAASVQGAITSVTNSVANGDISSAMNTVSTLGGSAFTLTPGTLSATIATTMPGVPVNSTITTNGASVSVSLTTVPSTTSGPDIPSLAGNEHIMISNATAATIANDMSTLLNIQNGIPNLKNFTASAVTNLLNNAMSNIVDQGLQLLLGSSIGNMLNNVTKLLPNIAGNILNTQNILPKTVLNAGSLTSALQQSTKNLALSRLSFNIAKSIFNKSNAESDSDMSHNLGQLAAQRAAETGGTVTLEAVNPQTGSTISVTATT
jgi:hypothetical protein